MNEGMRENNCRDLFSTQRQAKYGNLTLSHLLREMCYCNYIITFNYPPP